MSESALNSFGKWAATCSWELLSVHKDINGMAQTFMNTVQTKVDEIFPTKNAYIPINQKPWFSHKLKQLSDLKKEIFQKEGRSDKYKAALKNYENTKKVSIQKFIQRSVDTITDRNNKNIHKVLKKLGAAPGEGFQYTFVLPEHEGLSDQAIANDLAKYFSKISQEYGPLDHKLLPEIVKNKLQNNEGPIP